MTRPVLTVIAGPNGSGKSTIAEALRLPGESVNADDVARSIDPLRPNIRLCIHINA